MLPGAGHPSLHLSNPHHPHPSMSAGSPHPLYQQFFDRFGGTEYEDLTIQVGGRAGVGGRIAFMPLGAQRRRGSRLKCAEMVSGDMGRTEWAMRMNTQRPAPPQPHCSPNTEPCCRWWAWLMRWRHSWARSRQAAAVAGLGEMGAAWLCLSIEAYGRASCTHRSCCVRLVAHPPATSLPAAAAHAVHLPARLQARVHVLAGLL